MSEPSKTITLSDKSVWEHRPMCAETPWFCHAGFFRGHDMSAPRSHTPTCAQHLTASDHRKIADVLDPPPRPATIGEVLDTLGSL